MSHQYTEFTAFGTLSVIPRIEKNTLIILNILQDPLVGYFQIFIQPILFHRGQYLFALVQERSNSAPIFSYITIDHILLLYFDFL